MHSQILGRAYLTFIKIYAECCRVPECCSLPLKITPTKMLALPILPLLFKRAMVATGEDLVVLVAVFEEGHSGHCGCSVLQSVFILEKMVICVINVGNWLVLF